MLNDTNNPRPTRPISDEVLKEWTRALDQIAERAQRDEQLGRELVEQRALNLDLQRQIYRLQDELRALRESAQAREEGAGNLVVLEQPRKKRLPLLRRLLGKASDNSRR